MQVPAPVAELHILVAPRRSDRPHVPRVPYYPTSLAVYHHGHGRLTPSERILLDNTISSYAATPISYSASVRQTYAFTTDSKNPLTFRLLDVTKTMTWID